MKYYITLDGGTTNTRTILWNAAGEECAHTQRHVGIRDVAATGNKLLLGKAVRECIEELLPPQHISFADVSCVLGAGMITSDLGLYLLPHLAAPVGKTELAAGMKKIFMPEICPVPFWFVPGVKNTAEKITLENFTQMDIMRGEEVEVVALLEQMSQEKETIVVLPGSHSKFIALDSHKKILGCETAMTGEIYALLVSNSILSGATDKIYASKENYNREMCLKGYDTARKLGMGRAAFSTRILKNFAGISNTEAANFLLGVVLSSDIKVLEENTFFAGMGIKPGIVLTGKEPFRQGLYDILANIHPAWQVANVEPHCQNMSARGCAILAKLRGII